VLDYERHESTTRLKWGHKELFPKQISSVRNLNTRIHFAMEAIWYPFVDKILYIFQVNGHPAFLEINSLFFKLLILQKKIQDYKHDRDWSLGGMERGEGGRDEGLCHRADSYCNSRVRSGPRPQERRRGLFSNPPAYTPCQSTRLIMVVGAWKSNKLRLTGFGQRM